MGLAPSRCRLRLRRRRGPRDAAVRAVSADGRADERRGVADRRVGRWPRRSACGRRIARGVRRGLVDGVRLFCRRALVGGGGVPGRRGKIHLGPSARRCRAAGGPGVFPGLRVRPRSAALVAWTDAGVRARVRSRSLGMGAGAPLHRIPLERFRNDARRESGARPGRLARRTAWADVPLHRDFRCARDTLSGRRRPGRPRSDDSCGSRTVADGWLRGFQAGGACEPDCSGRQAAHHPAERLPRRLVRSGKQGRDPAPLLHTVGPRRDRRGHGSRGVTHFIWPESAFPFILSRDAQALGDIADFLHDGATLVTGAARLETDGGGDPAYFNSIEILDRRGLAHERYDKQHLVPFGEYVPFERWLERSGITQFVQIPGGFSPGSGPRVLRIPGLPVAMPLICYEAIFPTEIGDAFSGARRADWMLNLTDDAWFGLTPGPFQHYAQARLRAIELGLPLVQGGEFRPIRSGGRAGTRDRVRPARRRGGAGLRTSETASADLAVPVRLARGSSHGPRAAFDLLDPTAKGLTKTSDCIPERLRALRVSVICLTLASIGRRVLLGSA